MKRTAIITLLGMGLPIAVAVAQTVIVETPGPGTLPLAGGVSGNSAAVPAQTPVIVDSGDLLNTTRRIDAGGFVNGGASFTATGTPTGIGNGTLTAAGTPVTPANAGVAANTATTSTTNQTTTTTTGSSTVIPGAPGSSSATDRISNALSAAPPAITANATVLEVPATPGATSTVLRTGNNGWTCYPDDPATPANDPMCLDREWMNWLDAQRNRRAPVVTGTGLAYLLQGGNLASSMDALVTQPSAGQTWQTLPPHIRLLNPQRWDITVFPTTAPVANGGPWTVFAGTPYEFLLVPMPTAGTTTGATGTTGTTGTTSGTGTGAAPTTGTGITPTTTP